MSDQPLDSKWCQNGTHGYTLRLCPNAHAWVNTLGTWGVYVASSHSKRWSEQKQATNIHAAQLAAQHALYVLLARMELRRKCRDCYWHGRDGIVEQWCTHRLRSMHAVGRVCDQFQDG